MLKGLPRGIDSFIGCDRNDLDVEIDQRSNVLCFFLYDSFLVWSYGTIAKPSTEWMSSASASRCFWQRLCLYPLTNAVQFSLDSV